MTRSFFINWNLKLSLLDMHSLWELQSRLFDSDYVGVGNEKVKLGEIWIVWELPFNHSLSRY